jgi:histidinol-phosphate/aromatic aminotransferase/cobyric acid decarboxylase-like protein
MAMPAERVHGGPLSLDASDRVLLEDAPRLLDFSVNINPYGPPAALVEAVRRAPLDTYPDPQARVARVAWAQVLETAVDRIAVGHGAADLLWAIARALLAPGSRVLIAEPTFSEFRIAAAACGACIETSWAREQDGFRVSVSGLVQAARGTQALYLCAPNNPSGAHVSALEVAELARALPDTHIVLDQSFLALSEHAHELRVRMPDNVLCVRSLTKDFALPGLRVGLLVASRALIERVESVRPSWSTSAPAQAAIAAAAQQQAFVRESYEQMRADRDAITRLLQRHGCVALPSASVYQLIRVRVGSGAEFARRLLAHGVLVRDCASFGLPAFVRIASRPARDVAALEAALEAR